MTTTLTGVFSDIADAIRAKNGSLNSYTPTQMATAISAIPTGGGTYQSKEVSPTESSQTVTADSGYDALSSVTVNAISTTYVGSGIARKSSTNLTANGATVTAPAGYYASDATKSISNGSVTAPSSISGTGATVSTGTNTLTLSKTISVTPNVTTAGYISSGTAGNSSVSLTASVTTKAAATITPGTADQTIASGTYLTGTQTISGDANLLASNIKKDVSIFGVTGTYAAGGSSNIVQGTFTTGSSAGASSVTLSYSGSGYPIAAIVYVDGGPYNNTTTGNTTWYNSTQRYAVGFWSMVKSNVTTTPTFSTSGDANQGTVTAIYKNSTSSSTSYTRTSSMTSNTYSSSNASNAAATCVRFKSKTSLSYYVNTSSYGLLPGIKYAYIVIYSS